MDYRQRIINTFKELASMRGFAGVTVDELAAGTGISKRTIYRYFQSKEEIIQSVLEDFIFSVEQKVQQTLDSSDHPVEKFLNVLKVIPENLNLVQTQDLHDLQKYYPHLWEKVEQFRAERIFENLLTSNEQGFFRSVNPKIFTTAFMASVKTVVNTAFILEKNLTPAEAIQSLVTVFLYGIVRRTSEEPFNHD